MTPEQNFETRPAIDVDGLASQVELLDALHSAASEGRLQETCPLPAEDLRAWLGEIQYLAGETLAEMERDSRPPLRFVGVGEGRRSPSCAIVPGRRPGKMEPGNGSSDRWTGALA